MATKSAKVVTPIVPEVAAVPDLRTDIFGQVLTINFANGKELTLDAALLNDDIRLKAMMAGLTKKLIDGAAKCRSAVTGESVPIGQKFDAVKEIFDRISGVDGIWNKVREGAPTGNNLLIRAMMEVTKKSREATEAYINSLDKGQIDALKANKRIVDAMAALKPIDESIDTDSMLDGFMNDASPDDGAESNEETGANTIISLT